jgi:hypothetical protein
MSDDPDLEYALIDGTIVQFHQKATGAKGGLSMRPSTPRHGSPTSSHASPICPVSGWHDMIGEPTIADAIMDRIVHNAHRIDLKGDSMRRKDQNENLTRTKNRETMPAET